MLRKVFMGALCMLDWLLGKKKANVLSLQDQHKLPIANIKVDGQASYAWQHERSVLEVLDKAGLPVRSSCRSGNCGACVAYLLDGEVGYTKTPNFPLESGEILMCSCFPVSDIRVGLLSQPVSPRRRGT
jgi:ferredoxin